MAAVVACAQKGEECRKGPRWGKEQRGSGEPGEREAGGGREEGARGRREGARSRPRRGGVLAAREWVGVDERSTQWNTVRC